MILGQILDLTIFMIFIYYFLFYLFFIYLFIFFDHVVKKYEKVEVIVSTTFATLVSARKHAGMGQNGWNGQERDRTVSEWARTVLERAETVQNRLGATQNGPVQTEMVSERTGMVSKCDLTG